MVALHSVVVAVGALCTIAGCSSRDRIDVSAVNAAVPERLKYRLDFEPREITDGLHKRTTFVVPAPTSWRSTGIGSIEPADPLLDDDSSIRVASGCDAFTCTTSDASSEIGQLIHMHFLDVVRDERTEHRRVVVGKAVMTDMSNHRDATTVMVFWWPNDNAPDYNFCEVRLAAGSKDALPAFEKACELARVSE
jgi:hypothetical protein